jgi:uncharacterized tellurite resistance protein B-like protein
MLTDLAKDERLQLMKFVCSFVWADLEVRDEEVAFVRKMVSKLELAPAEKAAVEGWLKLPPKPEEVDPAQVPRAHRELFLQVIRDVIASDGEIATDEAEIYSVLEDLLEG